MSRSTTRRAALLVPVVLVASAAGVAATPVTADAAISCTKVGTSLRAGQTLYRGQCITSSNGAFTLVMQTDGNLVSYRNSDRRACFASGTAGRTDAITKVNALSARAPSPIELVVTRQSNAWNGYIGFDGPAAGHPASTLTVDVSSRNGSMWVAYGEYYGTNQSAPRRIC